MKYIIGTGFVNKGEWSQLFAIDWIVRLRSQYPSSKVVVMGAGTHWPMEDDTVDCIQGENLGHVGDYMNGQRTGQLCGWSASVVALCLIAYNCQSDLVYLEQDCLAFGPWLELAYADMGDGEFIFGKAHTAAPWMEASQSLFVIRNSFLLEFVREYLSLPEDSKMLPEAKFCEIERRHPAKTRRLSFGVDRQRPIPFDAPVFYGQQWTAEEIEQLKERGLC